MCVCFTPYGLKTVSASDSTYFTQLKFQASAHGRAISVRLSFPVQLTSRASLDLTARRGVRIESPYTVGCLPYRSRLLTADCNACVKLLQKLRRQFVRRNMVARSSLIAIHRSTMTLSIFALVVGCLIVCRSGTSASDLVQPDRETGHNLERHRRSHHELWMLQVLISLNKNRLGPVNQYLVAMETVNDKTTVSLRPESEYCLHCT